MNGALPCATSCRACVTVTELITIILSIYFRLRRAWRARGCSIGGCGIHPPCGPFPGLSLSRTHIRSFGISRTGERVAVLYHGKDLCGNIWIRILQ